MIPESQESVYKKTIKTILKKYKQPVPLETGRFMYLFPKQKLQTHRRQNGGYQNQ